MFKIYIATIIITILADIIGSIRGNRLSKIYGYKKYKLSLIDRIRKLILTLIIYVLPIINIILAIFLLAVNDDWIVNNIIKSDNFYKENDNKW